MLLDLTPASQPEKSSLSSQLPVSILKVVELWQFSAQIKELTGEKETYQASKEHYIP